MADARCTEMQVANRGGQATMYAIAGGAGEFGRGRHNSVSFLGLLIRSNVQFAKPGKREIKRSSDLNLSPSLIAQCGSQRSLGAARQRVGPYLIIESGFVSSVNVIRLRSYIASY